MAYINKMFTKEELRNAVHSMLGDSSFRRKLETLVGDSLSFVEPPPNSSCRVVNVRVKNIRPRYQNLKEWCEDPQNIYIGRGKIVFVEGERYPPCDSMFANKFKISESVPREESLRLFREDLQKRMGDRNFTGELEKLRGKTLGCWCKPEKCHGDILVEFLS